MHSELELKDVAARLDAISLNDLPGTARRAIHDAVRLLREASTQSTGGSEAKTMQALRDWMNVWDRVCDAADPDESDPPPWTEARKAMAPDYNPDDFPTADYFSEYMRETLIYLVIDLLHAKPASLPGGSEAVGVKAVPLKPTDTMIAEGMATLPGPTDLCEADIEDIWVTMLAAAPAPSEGIAARDAVIARPLSEWTEEHGNVVWWCWRDGEWLGEPAYIGSPLDLGRTVEVTLAAYGVEKLMRAEVGGWPGYHTHWTPHPTFPAPVSSKGAEN